MKLLCATNRPLLPHCILGMVQQITSGSDGVEDAGGLYPPLHASESVSKSDGNLYLSLYPGTKPS